MRAFNVQMIDHSVTCFRRSVANEICSGELQRRLKGRADRKHRFLSGPPTSAMSTTWQQNTAEQTPENGGFYGGFSAVDNRCQAKRSNAVRNERSHALSG
ncbi:hypothetical protein [Novipirellula caenicola]|uniref:Uncharacterized protein n=1 Tax=Novipirellula caenicola TaxID=1536901 RepID=A0ABP9VV60_9BACT